MNNIIYKSQNHDSDVSLGTYCIDPRNGAIYIIGRTDSRVSLISINTGKSRRFKLFVGEFPSPDDYDELLKAERAIPLREGTLEFIQDYNTPYSIGDIFAIGHHIYMASKIGDVTTMISLINGNRYSDDNESISDMIYGIQNMGVSISKIPFNLKLSINPNKFIATE
jgi:hypothetical protein